MTYVSAGFSTPAVPTAALLPAPAIFAAPRTHVSSIIGLSFYGETFSSTKLRNILRVLSISGSKGSKFEVLLLVIN